jgi:hypothetical protein
MVLTNYRHVQHAARGKHLGREAQNFVYLACSLYNHRVYMKKLALEHSKKICPPWILGLYTCHTTFTNTSFALKALTVSLVFFGVILSAKKCDFCGMLLEKR